VICEQKFTFQIAGHQELYLLFGGVFL